MTLFNSAQVEQILLPNVRDLGDGFQVRRALPSAQRRMVGPFIFLDSFGPVTLRAGEGLDSRPHPHIGLSTLTYLIDGEIVHRDSEGYVQTISPGEVNLMTAGRGIRSFGTKRRPGARKRRDGFRFPELGCFAAPVRGNKTWLPAPRRR